MASDEATFPSLVGRNLLRRPFRTIVLVICVAMVIGMQIAATLLDRASRNGLEIGLNRLGADLVIVPRGFEEAMFESLMRGEAGLFYMDAGLEQKIAQFDFVKKTTSQIFVQSLSGASCCSVWSVFLVGFEPETDFTVRPWLNENQNRGVGDDDILVGMAIEAEPGDKLKFFGHEFQVAGVLDLAGTGLDTTVFIPIETVYRMARESATKAEKTLEITENDISAVLVKLKPGFHRGIPALQAAREIEKKHPEVGVIMPDDILVKTQRNLSGTLRALRSASYIIWPITALLVGLVFAMSTAERQREIGMLRAMGATPGFVFRIIISEALTLTAIGAVLGLVVSVGLLAGFSRLIALSLTIPFYWPGVLELAGLFMVAVILALLTGLVAAFYPALKISRMEPYEAMRRSEQ
ncbi:MAG: ABC transporter permease [Deltaproteobacteria bacterium]|nr:ABC transporter permease [Deltaproteobacteria bacterium]